MGCDVAEAADGAAVNDGGYGVAAADESRAREVLRGSGSASS